MVVEAATDQWVELENCLGWIVCNPSFKRGQGRSYHVEKRLLKADECSCLSWCPLLGAAWVAPCCCVAHEKSRASVVWISGALSVCLPAVGAQVCCWVALLSLNCQFTVLEKEGKPPKSMEGNLAYVRLSVKNCILKFKLVAVGM